MTCAHNCFNGSVEVGRIIDQVPIQFVAEVTIHCEDCGLSFAFDENHFAVSADRLKLRYKLKPSTVTIQTNGHFSK